MTFHKTILRRLVTAALQLLCCLLVSGCFQPEGENFVTVEEPDAGIIDIILTDEVSELYIYKPSRISYHVNDGDYQLIRIRASIDGKSLFDPTRPTIVFIDPAGLSNGNHLLRMEATLISNSNTLASRLGKETQVFSKDFNVVVDLELPKPVTIVKIEPRDGSLYVSWEKSEKNNFLNYHVTRYRKTNDEWEAENRPDWNLNHNATGFNDSLYIGGPVKYRIDIQGYKFTKEGLPVEADFEMIEPVLEQLGGNSVKVSWPQSLFYKNLQNLTLGEYNKPDQYFDPTKPVSYTSDVPFGSVYLQYVSGFGEYSGYYTKYIRRYVGQELTFGETLPDYSSFRHFGSKELIASSISNPSNARLGNSNDHSITATVDFTPYYASAKNRWAVDQSQFGTAPDGNNLFLFTGSEVIRFDDNLNFVEQIDFSDLIANDDFRFAYNIKLSNNNIATFNFYPGLIGVFDLENNIAIAKDLTDTGPFNISPNGKFFFHNKKVYDISGGTMVETANFDNAGFLRDARFSDGSDMLFLSYDNGHFATIDTGTMTIISEFDIPDPGSNILGSILYDPVSGLCGIQNSWPGTEAELMIFNPVTQQMVKRLKISSFCHLYNNTLYSDYRFALPL